VQGSKADVFAGLNKTLVLEDEESWQEVFLGGPLAPVVLVSAVTDLLSFEVTATSEQLAVTAQLHLLSVELSCRSLCSTCYWGSDCETVKL